jgi:hypothetical protein
MNNSSTSTTKKIAKMSISEAQRTSVASKKTEKDQEKDDIKKLMQEVAKKCWYYTSEFVEAMNTAKDKPENSWIQLQTYRTYYYGVMASTVSYTNPKNGTEWVCVKVGFTQLDDVMIRPMRIREEVIKHFVGPEAEEVNLESIKQQVRIIFCVPQSPLDPKLPVDVEKAVRLAVGKPLQKDEAKSLKLPVPTEWVTTNVRHLKDIIEVCKVSDADSSKLTALDAYTGDLPQGFKLERTSKIIPESVIPDLLK